MVATEPPPREVWDAVGWSGCETIHDGRHLLIYAQRTADGRIAMGGRGAPYRFGSKVDDSHRDNEKVFAGLEETVRALFPAAAEARFTHRWGGPLGVPRDWFSSVTFDRSSGLASAGGYVGDGVSTSNLAGRSSSARHGDRPPAMGQPPFAPVGARAVAMAGRELGPERDGTRRPCGGADGAGDEAWRARQEIDRALTCSPPANRSVSSTFAR